MAHILLRSFLATLALHPISTLAAGTKSYNGLAITPAMGWDNWNAFGCKINQELLLTTAKKIVDYGLRDLGMEHSTFQMNSTEIDLIRVSLYHSGRLLVRWSLLEWNTKAQCDCFSKRYSICCRPTPQHGIGIWHVLLRWNLYLRPVRSQLGL